MNKCREPNINEQADPQVDGQSFVKRLHQSLTHLSSYQLLTSIMAAKEDPESKEQQVSKIRGQVKGAKTIWVGKPRFGFEEEYEKLKQLGLCTVVCLFVF